MNAASLHRPSPAARWKAGLVLLVLLIGSVTPATAAPAHVHPARAGGSIADTSVQWPTWNELHRTLLLSDYNTRVVVLGTTLLGVVGGVVGVFMLLRRRSLMGDVVGHSSLPGVVIAFLIMELAWPGGGRWMPGLLLGALAGGLLGMFSVIVIRSSTRIKEDASLAIVLSVLYGLGIALLTVVQKMESAAAGLKDFILGRAASLSAADVELIGGAAIVVLLICALMFKEFALLCFDEGYAGSQGWPVTRLDLLLMAMVSLVAVTGLQSVGLLLVVAVLIIPAAAARFWTDHLLSITLLAAAIGGASAYLGTMASALLPRLAGGPIIVLAGSTFFLLSMVLGTRRGALRRWIVHRRLQRQVGRHDLLRASYECVEPRLADAAPRGDEPLEFELSFEQLLARRSWDAKRLESLIRSAIADELFRTRGHGQYVVTEAGLFEARRVARNHRLWELYLISHADIAPSRVDRAADVIEHIVEPEILAALERQLAEMYPQLHTVPPSPHGLAAKPT